MTPPKEDELDILNIRKMKNEHFDKEQRVELSALMAEKRREKEAQKHVYDAAETSFNEYRDSHTGKVHPFIIMGYYKVDRVFPVVIWPEFDMRQLGLNQT